MSEILHVLSSRAGTGGVGWETTAGTGGWPVSLDSIPTPQICAETEGSETGALGVMSSVALKQVSAQ